MQKKIEKTRMAGEMVKFTYPDGRKKFVFPGSGTLDRLQDGRLTGFAREYGNRLFMVISSYADPETKQNIISNYKKNTDGIRSHIRTHMSRVYEDSIRLYFNEISMAGHTDNEARKCNEVLKILDETDGRLRNDVISVFGSGGKLAAICMAGGKPHSVTAGRDLEK